MVNRRAFHPRPLRHAGGCAASCSVGCSAYTRGVRGELTRGEIGDLVASPVPSISEDELAALEPDLREAFLAALAQEAEELDLTPQQRLMHRLCAKVDEVMYGGAAGCGKSHAAVWHADWLSRRYPDHRTLLLRSSFPELRRTLMVRARELISEGTWRSADREYRYPNDSVVEFGYCATEDDIRQYLSAEYDCIAIDESTDMTQEMIEMLRSRLRTSNVKKQLGVNPHLLLLTNPGGPSHTFHRDRYVDSTEGGTKVAYWDERDSLGRGRIRSCAYIPARVGDNPHIDPDYVSNLVAISDPAKRAQYLDGDWSVVAGQFFTEWDPRLHVEDPPVLDPAWPIYGGYDWGYADAAVLLLAAVDFDGVIHVFHEMHVTGATAAEQGAMFTALGHRPHMIAADPSIWRESGVGRPISSQLTEAGMLPLRRASNERVAGWNRVREFLTPDADLDGRPRIRISSDCTNLIRMFPLLPRDPKKPEDVKGRTDDHAHDALRYLLMSRPAPSVRRRPEPNTYEERVQEWVRRRTTVSRRPVHDVLGKL